MPSSWSIKLAGTCRPASSCRQTLPSLRCRQNAPSSIRSKMSGSSCATTGSRTASSNPTTISSTIAATLGTSWSISPGASCPLDCANGRTGSDQWELVLLGAKHLLPLPRAGGAVSPFQRPRNLPLPPLSRPSAPALRLLEPHALAAVTNIAWLEEYDPRLLERPLKCLKRACPRIGSPALNILDRDLGYPRRFCQIDLCPPDQGARRPNLPRRPCRNAASRVFVSGSFSARPIRTPMRRIRSPCCARAASGHAHGRAV